VTAFRRARATWLMVGAAAAVLLATAVVAATRRPRPAHPNVLLIVMDTTRADRCSVDGYARPTTPRLAEFARQGVVYRDAWTSSNWTGPAHASLFTGLSPEHHGFHRNTRPFLQDGADTLAVRLGGLGYATGCFTNNVTVSPEFGLVQGFDEFVPFYERRERTPPWARETHGEAAAWARTMVRDGKPFFLFINDMEAHLPYVPPQDVAARFVRGKPSSDEVDAARRFGYPQFLGYDLGVEKLPDGQLALMSDLYDAEVATLDAEICDLLDALSREKILDDTLVVITADHGENIGDHHLCEHSFGMYRTLLHVPLIVRMPGKFDGGRVVDDVVRIEDLYPTILEAVGAPVPPGLDGASLLAGVPGRVAVSHQPSRADYEPRLKGFYPSADPTKLMRAIDSAYDGRSHYLRFADGVEELFDVRSDPDEVRDVLASSPDVAAKMRALLGAGAPK
jgi:arylsulfatase A-like enzyme